MTEAAATPANAPVTARTNALLTLGIVVGPIYILTGLAQALTRDGFDLGRHPLSVLANGSLGWIQTVNFVVTGLLLFAAAIGIRQALRPHSRAAGWIVAVFGLGVLLAAVFPADPMDGFPPGTTDGAPESVSTAGMLHFVVAGTGFMALAASGFVVGRALLKRGERGLAGFSFITGGVVFLGFMIGGALPASLAAAGVWAAVIVGFAWLSVLCAKVKVQARRPEGA